MGIGIPDVIGGLRLSSHIKLDHRTEVQPMLVFELGFSPAGKSQRLSRMGFFSFPQFSEYLGGDRVQDVYSSYLVFINFIYTITTI